MDGRETRGIVRFRDVELDAKREPKTSAFWCASHSRYPEELQILGKFEGQKLWEADFQEAKLFGCRWPLRVGFLLRNGRSAL